MHGQPAKSRIPSQPGIRAPGSTGTGTGAVRSRDYWSVARGPRCDGGGLEAAEAVSGEAGAQRGPRLAMDCPGWHDRCHGHTIAAAGPTARDRAATGSSGQTAGNSTSGEF